jgi:hypothetical protein
VHRDEKIACENIRVEVAERRRETQLFGGDPTVCVAPFQTGRRKTLNRLLQIHRCHRIGVYAHVLREKTRESFQASPFQMEVRILKGPNQKRKTYDEADRCLCVAIPEIPNLLRRGGNVLLLLASSA